MATNDVKALNVDLTQVAGKYFVDVNIVDRELTRDDPSQFAKTAQSREGRSTQIYNKATFARIVAGCIVLSADFDRVLMISSSKHKNRWIFPKGGVEYDEVEDFRKTARRETWEEAGTVVKILRKLPVMEDHRFLKQSKVDKHFKGVDLTVDGDRIPRSEFHFFEAQVLEASNEWPEADRRQRKWCTYSEAKHELVKSDRPELVDALNESRIIRGAEISYTLDE